MVDDAIAPFRQQFDNARDPYTARNALGITSIPGSGGIAPANAQYITAATDPTLTAERVLTNTATVTWDFATAGQAKANATGFGNVSNSGTPAAGQVAEWVTATTIQGVSTYAKLASPVFTGDPTAPTPTAGDNDTSIATTAFTTTAVSTPHCGRLEYVSATALSFKPFNGDRIKINGNLYAIPSGGIPGLGNTSVLVGGGTGNLAASTLYLVFVTLSGGVPTASFQAMPAASHAASTTAGNIGTEIGVFSGTPNDAFTLIGMIQTNSSSQFLNTSGFRYVISWFNRRGLSLVGVSTGGASTASTSFVAMNTPTSTVFFLTWGDETIDVGLDGTGSNSTVTGAFFFNVGLDSASTLCFPADLIATCSTATHAYPAGGYAAVAPAEGFHGILPVAKCVSGTLSMTAAVTGSIRG